MLSTLTRSQPIAKQDQRQLFEQLMRDTHRQAYSLALRLTGNGAEAEDLVQEAFVRAYRFFHRYDDSMPFASWLYRILTNLHIDGMRRKGRLRVTSLDHHGEEGGTWDVADEESNADRNLWQGAMDEPIQQGLSAMNPEFRVAVLLADVEGMAYEEIADVMKCSIGTVRSRIHRGRKQLRAHLQRNYPGRYDEVLA